MELCCEWCHAWKWWAGNFGDFLKKQWVEIWLWARRVEIWLWTGQPARGWVKDDVGTVSIVKIVSLSPRVEKLKVKKKLINISYLNNESRQCFGISLHMNILHIPILAMLQFLDY